MRNKNKNYPNPTNDKVNIDFNTVGVMDLVQIDLYDNLGRKIKPLLSKIYQQGEHSEVLDVSEINSGLYYLILSLGNEKSMRKFIVMK